jgi:hypothetical protein
MASRRSSKSPFLPVAAGGGGVEVAEDHLLRLLVAGQRLVGGVCVDGDGVADAHVAERLDRGDQVADLAGPSS